MLTSSDFSIFMLARSRTYSDVNCTLNLDLFSKTKILQQCTGRNLKSGGKGRGGGGRRPAVAKALSMKT